MTAKARVGLADCEDALADLGENPTGSAWRRHWVAAVVLLRTVGHVLEKVDADTNPKLKATIEAEWEKLKASKPNPTIFWEFIERQRNQIVKQYQFNASQSVEIDVGT